MAAKSARTVVASLSQSAFRQKIVHLIRSVWKVNVDQCHAVLSTGIVRLAFPASLNNVSRRPSVVPILIAGQMTAALRVNVSHERSAVKNDPVKLDFGVLGALASGWRVV